MTIKDVFDLPNLIGRIDDKYIILALAMNFLLGLVWGILRADIFKGLSTEFREKFILTIIRYGFTGVGLIACATFAWAIISFNSQANAIAQNIPVSPPPSPGTTHQPTAVIPQAGVVQLAQYLAMLSRRLNAPKGISEAIERLNAGDLQPVKGVLNDVLAQQHDPSGRAQTLRFLGLLDFYKDPQHALEEYKQAVELDPDSWEAWTQLASLYERGGNHGDANEAAHKALQIGQRDNNHIAVGTAWNILGIIEYNAGRVDSARELFEKARDQFFIADAKTEYAKALNNIGRLYYADGKLEMASRYFEDAMSVDKQANNKGGEASDSLGRGQVREAQGDYGRALDDYNNALAISEEIGNLEDVAFTLSSMGVLYRDRSQPGDLERARNDLKEAHKLAQRLNNRLLESYALGQLGSVARAGNDLQEAENKYLEAIQIAKNVMSPFVEAVQQRGIGQVYFEQKKFVPALDAFQRAAALDRELNRSRFFALDQSWVGKVFKQLQQTDKACSSWAQALQIYTQSYKQSEYQDRTAGLRTAMAAAGCKTI